MTDVLCGLNILLGLLAFRLAILYVAERKAHRGWMRVAEQIRRALAYEEPLD